ncbi:HAD family phosphatase [Sphaerisporangium rubeum]|uniref:Putative hydrolase of the HAD superfamily n=1 Tax=Sphaerisporangium rubeum TaxID=321317 RepID=A0A7X0IFF8_9ACTN|nr:HAD-IA family hydrolase [Sphaerisporangium rubeum]MBB6474255.1 putative hydrolase of the HAD superfamily [Sphaerisporangium rubeum]
MKWVLFDYGEVLCHAQPEDDRVRLAEAAGTDAEAFWEGYWRHRLEFDRGTLTPRRYWSLVLGREAAEAETERLVELDVRSWSHENPGSVAVMAELAAAGHALALLSNAPECVARGVERLPWIETLRARFYSARLGLVKPDTGVYLRVAAELGCDPGEVVFVDDRLVNVEGAERAGMTALHFRDPGTLRADLEMVLAPR